MADILSAVSIANEFRQELVMLDTAAVETMLDAWQGVDARLLADMETFAASLTPGELLTPKQILQMERYQALYVQVEAQLAAMEAAAGPVITAGQIQAARQGALAAATTLDALGMGANFNVLPVAATENVLALARAGRPLAALLEPMYGLAAEGIIRELAQGVALGLGPRQIARRMTADGLTDGLNHLLLVTRDQYNRAHRTAAAERYRESGVVRGYVRRCARQAGRTCIACIALDGTFYSLDVAFEEHPQGRCAQIPAVRGVDMRPMSNGRTWFEGLSEEEQIATMGRGRWEAWREGRLPWEKMVRRSEHPVWGVGVHPAAVGRRVRRAAQPSRRAVPVFETTKEAEEWARRYLVDAGGVVDYSMVMPQIANIVNERLHWARQNGYVRTLRSIKPHPNPNSAALMSVHDYVDFKTAKLRSLRQMGYIRDEAVRNGREWATVAYQISDAAPADVARAIVDHEIGHMFSHNYYLAAKWDDQFANNKAVRKTIGEFDEFVRTSRMQGRQEVFPSGYSYGNVIMDGGRTYGSGRNKRILQDEAWAEVFAARFNGVELHPETKRLFDAILELDMSMPSSFEPLEKWR